MKLSVVIRFAIGQALLFEDVITMFISGHNAAADGWQGAEIVISNL